MSQQNPTIPTPTQAKGVDAHVFDLQTHLSFDLAWLTNGMGRAYKLQKRIGKVARFLPLVYLGTNQTNYFPGVADSSKKGQSIILIGDGTPVNPRVGQYGLMKYPISIIFSANLKTIDSVLLHTEDFTQSLIDEVSESLRNLLGKSYKLETTTITRQYEDVYSEFDISTDSTSDQQLPMTYFRFDGTLSFYEVCGGATLDRCTAINQNLTAADKNICLLPLYDMGDTTVTDNFTPQQDVDLTALYCTASVVNEYSTKFNGSSQWIEALTLDPLYDLDITDPFTFIIWIKINTLKEAHFINKFSIASGKGYFVRLTAAGEIRVVLTGNLAGFDSIDFTTTTAGLTADGNFHMIAVLKTNGVNASDVSVRVDNALQTKNVAHDNLSGTMVNTEKLQFGAGVSASRYFDGWLDEGRGWNIAYSAAQINKEWNGGSPATIPTNEANIIFNNNFGDKSLFGGTNRLYPDGTILAPLLDGKFISMGMTSTTLKTDHA